MKGREVVGHPGHKTAVIVDHAQESLSPDPGVRRRETEEVLDPGRKRSDAVGSDQMSQVFNLRNAKNTFLPVNTDTIGFQQAEQVPQVFGVGFFVRAGHQNVIEVNKSIVDIPEHSIHQALERLRSILQPERHAQEFK